MWCLMTHQIYIFRVAMWFEPASKETSIDIRRFIICGYAISIQKAQLV